MARVTCTLCGHRCVIDTTVDLNKMNKAGWQTCCWIAMPEEGAQPVEYVPSRKRGE